MKSNSVKVLIGVTILLACNPQDAHAYLDPGSGSLLFQVLIGVLLAAFFTIKLWWGKFKSFVTGLGRKKDDR